MDARDQVDSLVAAAGLLGPVDSTAIAAAISGLSDAALAMLSLSVLRNRASRQRAESALVFELFKHKRRLAVAWSPGQYPTMPMACAATVCDEWLAERTYGRPTVSRHLGVRGLSRHQYDLQARPMLIGMRELTKGWREDLRRVLSSG